MINIGSLIFGALSVLEAKEALPSDFTLHLFIFKYGIPFKHLRKKIISYYPSLKRVKLKGKLIISKELPKTMSEPKNFQQILHNYF